MYKTECSKCKKIYQTEGKYLNYICDDCQREIYEKKKRGDMAVLERLRQEMEDAIASGDKAKIQNITTLYNYWAERIQREYGST